MVDGEVFAGNLTLDFFDPALLMNDNALDPNDKALAIARGALAVLMMGWPQEPWGDLCSWRVFKAVFIKRDAELLYGMRRAFQEGFHHVQAQLQDKQFSELQQRQAEFFISNCLSLLPFADITPHESIQIPQYINGEWVLVDYKVVPIELTPTSGFDALFIQESDRVFAYGLEPIHNHEAEPHLIFMGTTYPAGQGFATQIHTDLEGFETAGKKLYRSGHKNITAWLDKQAKKTHVCGMSLGGALSLLLAIDQGPKLSRVDALNPPGLYDPWHKSQYDRWDSFTDSEKPPVYIQKQGHDPVSCFGSWKKDWHVLQVNPPSAKQGPNGLTDHALNYAGFSETQFIGVDTEADNNERKWRNLYLYTVTRAACYYLIMVPIHYVARPVVQYLINHPLQVALIIGIAVLFPYIPLTASLVLIGVTALLTAFHLMNTLMHATGVLCGTKPVKEPACHARFHKAPCKPSEEITEVDLNPSLV